MDNLRRSQRLLQLFTVRLGYRTRVRWYAGRPCEARPSSPLLAAARCLRAAPNSARRVQNWRSTFAHRHTQHCGLMPSVSATAPWCLPPMHCPSERLVAAAVRASLACTNSARGAVCSSAHLAPASSLVWPRRRLSGGGIDLPGRAVDPAAPGCVLNMPAALPNEVGTRRFVYVPETCSTKTGRRSTSGWRLLRGSPEHCRSGHRPRRPRSVPLGMRSSSHRAGRHDARRMHHGLAVARVAAVRREVAVRH